MQQNDKLIGAAKTLHDLELDLLWLDEMGIIVNDDEAPQRIAPSRVQVKSSDSKLASGE